MVVESVRGRQGCCVGKSNVKARSDVGVGVIIIGQYYVPLWSAKTHFITP